MASTGDAATWRLGRRPALDGLRGIAILLVMVGHWFIPGVLAAGSVGVTVFFTLSGFLITSLLLEERAAAARISLRGFYLRRVRRLMPALWVAVAASAVTTVWYRGWLHDWGLYIGALTYTTNFRMTDGVWGDGPGHTWSLSIEEQFYLLWPVLLLVLAKLPRRWLVTLLVYAVVASAIWRVHLFETTVEGAARVYYGTDTNAASLLIGCALAVFMHQRRERIVRWPIVPALALIGAACLTGGYSEFALMPPVVAAATAVIIYCAAQGPGVPGLSSRILRYCGKRSYGYYLFESACAWVPIALLGDSTWTRVLLVAPLSWLLAEVSWRFVETPGQRLLMRRRPVEVPTHALEPATAVAS